MDFPIHSPSSWEALSLILSFSDGRNTLFTLQKKLLLEFAMEALDNGNCRQLGTLENQKQRMTLNSPKYYPFTTPTVRITCVLGPRDIKIRLRSLKWGDLQTK